MYIYIYTHLLGYPGICEHIPQLGHPNKSGCIPIYLGTPVYGNTFPYTGVPRYMGNTFPYTVVPRYIYSLRQVSARQSPRDVPAPTRSRRCPLASLDSTGCCRLLWALRISLLTFGFAMQSAIRKCHGDVPDAQPCWLSIGYIPVALSDCTLHCKTKCRHHRMGAW
jgi:hypothetical protein